MGRRARGASSELVVVGVAMLAVLVTAWSAAGILRDAERNADQARLDGATATFASVLRIELQRLSDAGTDVGVTLSLVDDLDTDRYAELLDLLAIQDRFPGVFGVSLVDRVPRTELDEFLADHRTRDPGFELVTDGGEDLLRLVTFSHPLPDNAPVLGVDLSLRPESRAAADAAARSGRPRLSDGTIIVQLGDSEPGAVIHAPVPPVAGRVTATIGMVFSVQQLVERLELLPADVGIRVTDPSSAAFQRLAEIGDFRSDGPLTAEADVRVAGNLWRLETAAEAGFTTPFVQRGSTAMGLGGLLAALFAGLFVRTLVSRERLASDLVVLRTAELSRVNEQLAETNAALEDANQTKDAFLASISHELRTPLTVIAGFVDAMQRVPTDHPDRERFLEPIQRNVRRLDALVADLLTLASLDAGAIRAFSRPVDLGSTLPDLPATLAGITADVEVSVERSCAVDIDPRHLDRILVNLLINAERHGRPPFELDARRVPGDLVEIRVRDHGPGVPEGQEERVFDRFTRGEPRGTVPGTGLGLSIVRELAELNGGEVRYEPADPGACFVVRLPAAGGAPSQRSPSLREQAGQAPQP